MARKVFLSVLGTSFYEKYTYNITGKCMQWFDRELEAPQEDKISGKLFINFSNHPSDKWEDIQLDAARQYGECIDIAFPQIDPAADNKEIELLAKGYIAQIMQYATNNEVTVHVMGEMCFTYHIVAQLKSHGIRCLCSTSQRHVCEEAGGRKVVEFHFTQFREY